MLGLALSLTSAAVLKDTTPGGPAAALLLEDGGGLLLEDGGALLLE